MSTKTTTIRVRRETYEDLSKQGSGGDSFDEVIQRLLNKDKVQEVKVNV
jgi:predicted CopG family antitoxin